MLPGIALKRLLVKIVSSYDQQFGTFQESDKLGQDLLQIVSIQRLAMRLAMRVSQGGIGVFSLNLPSRKGAYSGERLINSMLAHFSPQP